MSENNIDSEMSGVMQGIARNKSIISLNISKNMTGTKPKHLPAVMEAIVQLLQVIHFKIGIDFFKKYKCSIKYKIQPKKNENLLSNLTLLANIVSY